MEPPPLAHHLEFPPGFADSAWEVESKGWLQGVVAVIDGKRYPLMIYDPVRLAQDIASELANRALFFEPNLVVVPSVTAAHVEAAVSLLISEGGHLALRAASE